MSVSVENKAIGKHAFNAFGGTPSVRAYHHDREKLSVDLLRCDDRPCGGVTSYSTIGLSDSPMFKVDDTEFPTRLEIAGACATAAEFVPNILASAAFCIMRTQKLYCPGSVLPEYVREYYPSTTVPHLYFTAPFLWEDSLKTLDCGTKKVSWLLVVPIAEAEQEYLREHGDNALEDLFEKHQIDIFDLNRPSVI
jgi:antitoxin YqcF